MYVGGFSEELDELVERLRRALDEDKPIDVLLEYYGPKFKESVMRGDTLF